MELEIKKTISIDNPEEIIENCAVFARDIAHYISPFAGRPLRGLREDVTQKDCLCAIACIAQIFNAYESGKKELITKTNAQCKEKQLNYSIDKIKGELSAIDHEMNLLNRVADFRKKKLEKEEQELLELRKGNKRQ